MRVFLLCLLWKILFFKRYRPWESSNIIFILPTDRPTDRPYFFVVFGFALVKKTVCQFEEGKIPYVEWVLVLETRFHIFCECDYVKSLWLDLVQCLQNGLILQLEHYRLTFLGFLISQANKVFINHILLIFKLYVFKSREKKLININNLIAEICNLSLLV